MFLEIMGSGSGELMVWVGRFRLSEVYHTRIYNYKLCTDCDQATKVVYIEYVIGQQIRYDIMSNVQPITMFRRWLPTILLLTN